jgi:hypothetical protein
MGTLTDLEVERVDGVDRPATKRRFLITKAEGDGAAGAGGEGDGLAAAKKLLAAAARALGGVHASKSEYDADTADALNELAEAAGLPAETRFTKATPVAPPAGAPAPAIDVVALAKAIGTSVGEEVRKALAEEVAKATEDPDAVGEGEPIVTGAAAATTTPPPPSAQPAGQTPIDKTAIRKNGEGLFGNVVFGKN